MNEEESIILWQIYSMQKFDGNYKQHKTEGLNTREFWKFAHTHTHTHARTHTKRKKKKQKKKKKKKKQQKLERSLKGMNVPATASLTL